MITSGWEGEMTMRSFFRDSKGNAAIIFAAAAVPLMIAAGMGIDMVRANRTQTILQGAADAAALAGGSASEISGVDINAVVEEYVRANGVENALDIIESIEPKLDKDTRTFSVKIKGKLDTSLMKLANINSMDIGASSEVVLGGKAIEVVLVLDSTASMGREGRMAALKVAAQDLVNDLLKLKDKGVDIKIGIVPFGDYVNIGLSRRSESWLDVANDGTVTSTGCYDTYPDAVKSNCRMENYTYYNDGEPMTGTQEVCDWSLGTPVQQCGTSTRETTWYGCVGSRNDPLDENVGSTSTPYPGIMDWRCASPIVDMTSNKDTLKDAIDGLVTSGNTYIPAGLIWGWNMINPSEPLSAAKSASEMLSLGGTKAIVLMTDGANTLSATYPKHNGSDAATANEKTRDICKNIKKDKVTMFTVSFMVDNTQAEGLMLECASDPSKNFNADSSADLLQAFNEIGEALSALRITK
jgi:Flp pilus assembly protein TadG